MILHYLLKLHAVLTASSLSWGLVVDGLQGRLRRIEYNLQNLCRSTAWAVLIERCASTQVRKCASGQREPGSNRTLDRRGVPDRRDTILHDKSEPVHTLLKALKDCPSSSSSFSRGPIGTARMTLFRSDTRGRDLYPVCLLQQMCLLPIRCKPRIAHSALRTPPSPPVAPTSLMPIPCIALHCMASQAVPWFLQPLPSLLLPPSLTMVCTPR